MNPAHTDQQAVVSRRRWMAGIGFSAAITGAAVAWWRLRPDAVLPEAVADFWKQRFTQPAGGEMLMADFRGRPLLINFWATWCPPCIEELPMIEAFWRRYGPRGLQVAALAIDQPSSVRRFLERQPLSFPVGLAGLVGTQLSKALGNTAGGLPFSVFFAHDGSIYKQKLGQLNQSDLDVWRDASL